MVNAQTETSTAKQHRQYTEKACISKDIKFVSRIDEKNQPTAELPQKARYTTLRVSTPQNIMG
jgi:hypothetical protein